MRHLEIEKYADVCVSIRQHTSAYVSIRRDTSAYVGDLKVETYAPRAYYLMGSNKIIDGLLHDMRVACDTKDYGVGDRVYDRFLSVVEPGCVIQTVGSRWSWARGRLEQNTRRVRWKFYKSSHVTYRLQSTRTTVQHLIASTVDSWRRGRLVCLAILQGAHNRHASASHDPRQRLHPSSPTSPVARVRQRWL